VKLIYSGKGDSHAFDYILLVATRP
jgi:hypothetical protein